jgi:hypothetical protein
VRDLSPVLFFSYPAGIITMNLFPTSFAYSLPGGDQVAFFAGLNFSCHFLFEPAAAGALAPLVPVVS